MKKSLMAVAFAFMSLSAAHAAERIVVTADSPYVAQLDVSYADLNLANPAGARAMLGRINFAAKRVCGGEPDFVDIAMRRFFKTCVHIAVDDAVDQLRAPLVTSLYLGRPVDGRFAYQNH